MQVAPVRRISAKRGDHIVVVAGIPFATPGTTNNLRVVAIRARPAELEVRERGVA